MWSAVLFSIELKVKVLYVLARAQEDGISFLQASESALLEISALAVRLRELAVQKSSVF